jgi:hypothetical protein
MALNELHSNQSEDSIIDNILVICVNAL